MKNLLVVGCLVFSGLLSAQKPFATSQMEVFGDHIFIKLSIDGSSSLDFIFDTGDGLTVIDLDVAKSLKIPLNESKKGTSSHGAVAGSLILHNYIEMMGVRLESDIKVYATSLKHLEMSIGRNIDGIIGYDLLEHYAVEIDHLNRQFKLHKGDTYKYTGIGEKFEMGLLKYTPFIQCTVQLNSGESLVGNFFVNTGAGTTLDFNSKFAKANNVIEKTGLHYSYLVKGLSTQENLHYEGRVQQLQMGKLTFDNLPIGISTAKKGIQANKKVAGIIGNRILKKYNTVYDYKNKALYLERIVSTNMDFHVNACGFEVQLGEDQKSVLVHRVYEIGAAVEQGIELNDQILKIDGVDVSTMTLPQLEKRLNEDGKTIELVVSRNGQELTFTLELVELI